MKDASKTCKWHSKPFTVKPDLPETMDCVSPDLAELSCNWTKTEAQMINRAPTRWEIGYKWRTSTNQSRFRWFQFILILIEWFCFFFSSPEPKAQVSFSDRLLSVVHLYVYKLLTISSSSPEPLGRFNQNLAQCILGWKGFNYLQRKGHALFKGKIIMK